LLGNGLSIASGDTTPCLDDHTDFGSANVTGRHGVPHVHDPKPRHGDLNLIGEPIVAILPGPSGFGQEDFTVTLDPVSPVAPGVGAAAPRSR